MNSLEFFYLDTVAIRTWLVDAHLAGIYKPCGAKPEPRHAVVDKPIEVASGIVFSFAGMQAVRIGRAPHEAFDLHARYV